MFEPPLVLISMAFSYVFLRFLHHFMLHKRASEASSVASEIVTASGSTSSGGSVVQQQRDMAFGNSNRQEIDEDLHSRQLAVYGRETMRRLFASNVLISGMHGLGAEIVILLFGWFSQESNLAGVKSVTLHDERVVELWDLSSNFVFSEDDVGKNRADASVHKLQDLNNAVVVSSLTTSLTKEHLSGFQVCTFVWVVLVGWLPSASHRLVKADVRVEGMTELNDGKPRKIKSARPYSFTLEEDTTGYGTYVKGGIVTQVKQPKLLNFKPLREALSDPGDFLFSDFSKFDRPPLLHLAFQALDRFTSEAGRFPVAGSEEDAQQLISIATSINTGQGDLKVDNVDHKLLRHFAFGAKAVLNPMAAMFGGIVGQEVVKACSGKFHPLFQVIFLFSFFYFDSVESLPSEPLDSSDVAPRNSRYDAQISVFGAKFQQKLEDAKVFTVGSGALGCEFLKNMALMGVSCGDQGKLTVTDDDIIEKSNLSRQFLFRDWNIGQAKSTVAASAAAAINPKFNIEALQNRVGR
ncbi:hypothetical protein HID58_096311 [Brassica napus]|uniref:E1 ubiquitin-activating enzyme n=1 Tax=Brassica napus TaxID=3708 RepID=A0ABQ7X0S8_BRANA|nr:hypothetical protein HID58_096311 [Brassica napus]